MNGTREGRVGSRPSSPASISMQRLPGASSHKRGAAQLQRLGSAHHGRQFGINDINEFRGVLRIICRFGDHQGDRPRRQTEPCLAAFG